MKKRIGLILFMLLLVILTSCQKQKKITIYMGPDVYTDNLDELMVKDWKYDDALERCEERLRKVPEDSLGAAEAYKIMGGIYATYLLDKERAIYYIEKAIEIDRKEDNKVGLAQDYTEMSKITINIGGKPEEGLNYLDKARDIYKDQKMEYTIQMADILSNKGHIYKNNKEYDKALDNFEKAQAIYTKNNGIGDITVYLLKGQTFLELEEYEKSEQEYLKAQELSELESDIYSLSNSYFQLAYLYGVRELREESINYYNKALEIYEVDEVFLKDEARTFNNIAFQYGENREKELAFKNSIKANQIILKAKLINSETEEQIKNYKHNLQMYYEAWFAEIYEEEFEDWYQRIIVNGEDWEAGDK